MPNDLLAREFPSGKRAAGRCARFLEHKGVSPLALVDCVAFMRQWRLTSLSTYLSAAQVQKILMLAIGPPMGRRNTPC